MSICIGWWLVDNVDGAMFWDDEQVVYMEGAMVQVDTEEESDCAAGLYIE